MEFYIRDKEQAFSIIDRYNKCGICSECGLTAEGWKCLYLYERAVEYLEKHK